MLLSNLAQTIGYNVDNLLFDGYGPGGKKKMQKAANALAEYKYNLEGGVHVSAKVPYWIPEEIKEYCKDMTSSDEIRFGYKGRAFGGYLDACHVFAYLSGKEASFGESLDKSSRLCCNMICTSVLRISPIYKGEDVKNITRDLSEYGIDGPKARPIVTKETLVKAFEMFPVDNLDVSSFMPVDNDVDVMDVEEDIVKEKKEEQTKAEQEKAEQPQAEVIVLEPQKPVEAEDNGKPIIDVEFKEESEKEEAKQSEPEEKAEDPVETNEDKVESEEKKDENKSPIFKFDNDKLVLFPEDGVSKVPVKQAEKFKRIFGEYLEDKKYELHRLMGGPIECLIHRENGGYITHVIDPGLCIGDDYYVIGSFLTQNPLNPVDTIMVHPSEKDIVAKIFNTVDHVYMLTPEEVSRAMTHMFSNQRIYNVFDFSNMGDRITRIRKDEAEYEKFEKILSFIIRSLDGTPMLGRMRFNKWSSVENFELVSYDSGKTVIRSPFPPQTMDYKSGVKIQVANGEMLVYSNGNTQKITISDL
jgi:hypothetical protein